MGSQCFANESLSHHGSPLTFRQRQKSRYRSVTLYTRLSPPAGFHFRALLSLLVFFLSCNSLLAAPVSAVEVAHGDRPALLVQDDLAWGGSPLYIDERPPPFVPLLMPPIHSHDDATDSSSAPPSKRALDTASKPGGNSFTIPSPFDTGLSNNFTGSCADFLSRLRNSAELNDCHPFSLFLQVSISSTL
jgi:hypothetical protein